MSVLDGDFNNGRQSLNVIMDKKNKKPWTVKIREKEFPGICRLFMLTIALLAAHRLKLAGKGENPLGAEGSSKVNAASGFGLASVSEGSTSVSFNTANMNTNDDSWYALTSYGMEYLNLRRIYVMSIVSAGER